VQKPVTIDFETEAIGARPKFPKPVGVAIKEFGRVPRYYSWGHPTKNGIYELRGKRLVSVDGDPLRAGKEHLAAAYKSPAVLGHNIFKFDLAVAEDHLGLKQPAWDRVHDTMFTLFLHDPHAASLALKPSAEQYLGVPPEERDEVYDWLAAHGIISKPQTRKGVLQYPKSAAAFVSKAPGDLVARYAIGDVVRTEALHTLLFPKVLEARMQEPYDRERRLAPLLLTNERQGMRVDLARLTHDLALYERSLAKAEAWIKKKLRLPAEGNLDSDDDVAAALRVTGVVKAFPKTPTGKDSVSKKNLTAEFFTDEQVWLALYYRNALNDVLVKSMRPWAEEASRTGGYVYTTWNQVRQSHGEGKIKGARSGRITCSYFQNISKTFTDRGDGYRHPEFLGTLPLPLVRVYLCPDPGHVWGHIDYNQQELRLVAHYEEGALAEAYRSDPSTDIHTFVQQLIRRTAGVLYERRPVKIVDFRTVYGGGIAGLAEQLKIPYGKAKEIITNWKRALPDVVSLDSALKQRFRNGQHLRTYGGRVYYVKPPAIAKKGPRKGERITFEYTALNYLIQPSGADVTKEALIRYEQKKKHGRLVVTVHDEVNITVPPRAAKEEMQILKECMESVKLDVPWRSEVKLGPSWGELKKEAA
jgi:DNA polymerase-1